MFDIGFSELLVIGVVALVVLGPERLPKVARTAGHLFGRLQRYVASVKADLNREMEMSELAKVKQEVQEAARAFEQSAQQHAGLIENETRGLTQAIEKAAGPAADPLQSQKEMLAAQEAGLADPPEPAASAAMPTDSPARPSASVSSTSSAPVVQQGLLDLGIEPSRRASRAAAQ